DEAPGAARASQVGRREGQRCGVQQRRGALVHRHRGLPPLLPQQPAAPRLVAVRAEVRGGGDLDDREATGRGRRRCLRRPDQRRDREHRPGRQSSSGFLQRARSDISRDRGGHYRARGNRQGVLAHEDTPDQGARGSGNDESGREGHGRRDVSQHYHGLRVGPEFPSRRDRSCREASTADHKIWVRPARGLLPRRLRVAVREEPGLFGRALRLRGGGSHLHLRGHAQVWVRAEGDVGGAVQEQGAATPGVLLFPGVDRGAVRHSHHRREPSWRTVGGLLGIHGRHGPERVREGGHGHHGNRQGDCARCFRYLWPYSLGGTEGNGGVLPRRPRRQHLQSW
ncbi:unnamed protein product, partial [Ectocarpus fasciculatus]